eukprot:TRINITY_DN10471_c0_g1_i1.p1 TRINITY_DN10471_c0_g1~~TRINITY_DN10471_c0_g1_i1.p1  ORF type:complete len:387 (-),score=104.59 TRINITY_DN10471_c0_g1_i1:14-1174(-)
MLPKMTALKGRKILSLHGRAPQERRLATLQRFTDENACILLATDVASRGLDIPNVEWIVQFDAPQDPAVFVHRVGRTARMGHSGKAVVMLCPEEASYIEFMTSRDVPLLKRTLQDDVPSVTDAVFDVITRDRDIMDKGVLAFISYMRAYKEHQCSYIFRMDKLDISSLAMTFGLLRLPHMPELKKMNLTYVPPRQLDPKSVPYTDSTREKQRLEKMAKEAAAQPKEKVKRKQTDQWSERKERQAKRLKKADARLKQILTTDEIDEISREEKLVKKLRSGKITLEQFELLTGERQANDEANDEADDADVPSEDSDDSSASSIERSHNKTPVTSVAESESAAAHAVVPTIPDVASAADDANGAKKKRRKQQKKRPAPSAARSITNRAK